MQSRDSSETKPMSALLSRCRLFKMTTSATRPSADPQPPAHDLCPRVSRPESKLVSDVVLVAALIKSRCAWSAQAAVSMSSLPSASRQEALVMSSPVRRHGHNSCRKSSALIQKLTTPPCRRTSEAKVFCFFTTVIFEQACGSPRSQVGVKMDDPLS